MKPGRPLSQAGEIAKRYGVSTKVIERIGVVRFVNMSRDMRMMFINASKETSRKQFDGVFERSTLNKIKYTGTRRNIKMHIHGSDAYWCENCQCVIDSPKQCSSCGTLIGIEPLHTFIPMHEKKTEQFGNTREDADTIDWSQTK